MAVEEQNWDSAGRAALNEAVPTAVEGQDWDSIGRQGLDTLTASLDTQNLDPQTQEAVSTWQDYYRTHGPDYADNTVGSLSEILGGPAGNQSSGLGSFGSGPSAGSSGGSSGAAPSIGSTSGPSAGSAGPAPTDGSFGDGRTEVISGGRGNPLNTLSNLLGLSNDLSGNQQGAGQGQQQISIPGVSQGQSQGLLSGLVGDNTGSSFGGLITNNQPAQQQVPSQPLGQQIQQGMEQFSIGGSKGASDPLFKGSTQKGASTTGGSQFGGMSPTPAYKATTQQANQGPMGAPSAIGQQPLPGEAPEGQLGGVPAVGGQPGMNALGGPLSAGGGPQGASMGAPGGTSAGAPGEVSSEQKDKGALQIAGVIDPDDKEVLFRVQKDQPKQETTVLDPDNDNTAARAEIMADFNKKKAPEPVQQTPVQQQPQAEPEPSGSPIVESFKQGLTNSMVNLGGTIMYPFRDQSERDSVQRYLGEENKALASKQSKTPHQYAAGRIAGELLPFSVVPGGKVTKAASFLKKAATRAGKGAAGGATYGGSQYAPSGTGKIQNALLGAALGSAARTILPMFGKAAFELIGGGIGAAYGYKKGGVAGAAGGALAGVAAGYGAKKGFKGIGRALTGFRKKPTDLMLQKEASKIRGEVKAGTVNPAETAKRAAAAKKLGVNLTTGEKTQSAKILGDEGRLAPSKRGVLEAAKSVNRTEEQITSKMKDTIKSVLPKGASPERVSKVADKLYNSISKKPMSSTIKKEVIKNDSIKEYMGRALKADNNNASLHPKGSIGRLVETEKYVRDEINQLVQKGSNPIALRQAANKIRSLLDKEFPRYLKARNLAQKGIVYRNLTEDVGKIKLKGGKVDPTVDQWNAGFFGSKIQKDKFLKDLEQTGGNVGQAKDLQVVLNSLQSSNLKKLMSKNTSLVSSQGATQGIGGAALATTRKAFLGHYDSLHTKMITNPNYSSQIAKLAKLPAGKVDNAYGAFLNRVLSLEVVREGVGTDDVPTDPKTVKEIKKQMNAFIVGDPDKTPSSKNSSKPLDHRLLHSIPMAEQVPKVVTKAISKQAKDKKARGIADMIMKMGPKEFGKYSGTLKGRLDLLKAAKKYGGPDAEDKLRDMFRKQDGASRFTPTTIVGAAEEKIRQLEAKTAAKAEARKTRAIGKLPSRKVSPDIARAMEARLRQRKVKQRTGRRVVLRGGTGNSLSARIMSIILSHLINNSKVQELLKSASIQGKVARVVIPEIRRKAQGR